MAGERVKENVVPGAPLSCWALAGALAATAAALVLAAQLHGVLPEPVSRGSAPPDRFAGETAREHLAALAALGPRVAGSYENEVAAVRLLVAALREIARSAAPHNRIDIDVHTANGAFPLAFFDGMNNVYRNVQMVVARVSARGARPAPRPALLLNCHYDTVPDSPGASDDAAGCAVLLETLRAVAAAPRPLRADLLVLLNGAEENIMQASHGFVTTHRWAPAARVFINLEACGAGGREVLFQAGPHDPWILETYAAVVPRPFASSLAQELFQSGLVPADTDFRVFRDFGNLSGVDLAWSANGYVYHTHLDTAAAAPAAALQRAGDNVLALTRGLLDSERLRGAPERTARQPVFFDVVGVATVSARAPAALAAAAAAAALVLAAVELAARAAVRELRVRRAWWWRAVGAAAAGRARAAAAGVLAAAAVGAALHAAGARLTWYSRPWLLAPLYGAPALAGAWWAAARQAAGAGWALRGWRGARAWHQAGALWAAGALAVCCACGLRSGFVPTLWAVGAALGDVGGAPGGRLAARWAVGLALPVLQTCYLAVGSLEMFVPVMGRAGAGAVPADVVMAVAVSALTLAACSWALPLAVAARGTRRAALALAGVCAAGCALALLAPPEAAYSARCPQRLMVFHVRRELLAEPAAAEHFYWVPELDANTGRTARALLGPQVAAAECLRWAYCGLPYYLPVLSLVPRSLRVPAPGPPAAATLRVRAHSQPHNASGALVRLVRLEIAGPSHVVVAVAPAPGGRVTWSSAVARPLAARRGGEYFFALHEARAPAAWRLLLHVAGPPAPATVSVAGHSMSGPHRQTAAHRRLLAGLPSWVAATGWAVHMQLLTV